MNDINKSTTHTTWNCKYHIVFVPKFRRKILYRQKRAIVGKILRKLCERRNTKIIEAEVCADHILVNLSCASHVELFITRNDNVTIGPLNVSFVFSIITIGNGNLLNLEFPITDTRGIVIQVSNGLSLPHTANVLNKVAKSPLATLSVLGMALLLCLERLQLIAQSYQLALVRLESTTICCLA